MPRKQCYWTRKLELELVEFVRQRDFIWRPVGNTNHHIQQKYKAYAEFASRLGRGFTARSVRDRWVNIRSTFNHNLRRVDKSKETAKSPADIYVPCWPLWKPLQFLRETSKKDEFSFDNYDAVPGFFKELSSNLNVKEELQSEVDDVEIGIRQRGQRTDRPRKKNKGIRKSSNARNKCKQVINELLQAMRPLGADAPPEQPYWFFAKHVVGRLSSMRKVDADCAATDILKLLDVNMDDIALKSE
ncbi:unnamed protein product [Arctia plantaginis]|uniref:MADF domain-containing protein n=1 Tax=Arctia plantaginis TaxID=874455 RepID=A0A8S0ZZ87_ARCPL|nr:unnamed protein product [Arctia plantaginis]CAB3237596.1 unnamed protein product [Arctia plantaginis]